MSIRSIVKSSFWNTLAVPGMTSHVPLICAPHSGQVSGAIFMLIATSPLSGNGRLAASLHSGYVHLRRQQVERQIPLHRQSPQPFGELSQHQPRRDRRGVNRALGGAGTGKRLLGGKERGG